MNECSPTTFHPAAPHARAQSSIQIKGIYKGLSSTMAMDARDPGKNRCTPRFPRPNLSELPPRRDDTLLFNLKSARHDWNRRVRRRGATRYETHRSDIENGPLITVDGFSRPP